MKFQPLDSNSQNYRILQHLARGRTLTPIEALRKFRTFRLGARIWELKRRGHKFHREMVKTAGGAIVASYSLERLARGRV
ncbi:MAG: helix-turn-helix domain-containing protein [Terriglobia bacterium]|nr:helix-turn-helix domain-containing protein [Terriglobia bacterium]